MKALNPRPAGRPALPLLAILALALAALVPGLARAAGDPAVEAARADLAKRLSRPLAEVRVLRANPVEFPDAALGFPRPDEVRAAVRTRGRAVVLEAGQARYLYALAGRAFRYGGPLHGWKYSALALRPVPDEPNLNGHVIGTSLAGTNPEVVLRLVSEFAPQADGSILGVRRTSRSGNELVYLAPGTTGEGTVLLSTFYACMPVLDPSGRTWAAVVRPRVGSTWTLVRRGLQEAPDRAVTVPLPEGGRPTDLYWEPTNPVIRMQEPGESGRVRFFELAAPEGPNPWRELSGYEPRAADLQLNKSERLEIGPTLEGDGTRVSRTWFTGTSRVLATIPHFATRHFDVSPAGDFVLLSGRSGEEARSFAVDLHTGEVLPLPGAPSRLLLAPPRDWTRVKGWFHL